MPSAYDFERSIVNSLRVTDPQLDTGLGTTVRKIISAVALELANYSTDQEVTSTLYSLESVSGSELDYLIGQFGFSRQLAKSASGNLVIRRDNADSFLPIPYGSQFFKPATNTSAQVVFQTTAYAEMIEGVTEVTVSVVAVDPGVTGNVAKDTVTISNDITGYYSVTNPTPMTGGRDDETDDAFRERFLSTVFRNESGTKDQYLALCLANANATKASFIGQATRYMEVIQVEAGAGGALSASLEQTRLARDVKGLVDDRRVWVSLADTDAQMQRGEFEFEFTGGNQPEAVVRFHDKAKEELIGPVAFGGELRLYGRYVKNLVLVNMRTGAAVSQGSGTTRNWSLDATNGVVTIGSNPASLREGDTLSATYVYSPVVEGDFVKVEFDYVSRLLRGNSRACEVFTDGYSITQVSDIEYLDLQKVITSSNRTTWLRKDGTQPRAGNLYVPLSYTPMMESTGAVNVGTSIILKEGVHFNMLYDATKNAGSRDAIDSIELIGSIQNVGGVQKFVLSANTDYSFTDNTPMNIPYYFNRTVASIQELVDLQSTVTAFPLVHYVTKRKVGIYMTVMYSAYPREGVAEQAVAAVSDWAAKLPIGQTVQVSDIETIIATTPGMDNVRLSTQADCGGKECPDVVDGNGLHPLAYGILELERDGTTFRERHTTDFTMSAGEELEVSFVRFYDRAQRQW